MCFELLTDKNFQGEDFLKCSDLHVDKETLFPLLKSDSSLWFGFYAFLIGQNFIMHKIILPHT